MKREEFVLLLTNNRESDHSKKIIEAATLAHQELLIEGATFHAFSRVLDGGVSTIIADYEELGKIADYFHKAVRVFHRLTPFFFSTPQKILREEFGHSTIETDVSIESWRRLLVDSVGFDKKYYTASQEFALHVEKIKHLTGEPLTKALEEAQSETIDKVYYEKMNQCAP